MKIIFLHGEDTSKSYERLHKFIETAKKRSWEVNYVDESNLLLQETLSSASLFAAERFYILRDVRRLGKKEIEWLNKKYADLSGNFIIYHEGKVGATFQKSLPKDTKVEEFKLPKIIFLFLELFYPGNFKSCLMTFHKVIEIEPIEFVVALLGRHLKDLYLIKIDEGSLAAYPSWRISKLKTQSKKFSKEELKSIINELSEIDILSKTSKLNIINSLDLLIVSKLK